MKRIVISKAGSVAKRNPIARSLCSPAFRKRVVQSKVVYNRKQKENGYEQD